MASSSSSSRTWQYDVFASFHGPDVRTGFLSHLRNHFNCKGITMFDDQKIVRSHTIGPSLTQGIRESMISIVILSKNYASSRWCLDELLEIFKCKDEIGQIVMTIFYGVDPSDVRKQIGYFGSVFNETCALKTEEERRKWSKALNYAGNIAGEHSFNWKNEAEMIEKIAKDVLHKLIDTPSRDFDGMVGLEAHLRELESLLELDDNVGVKMVGISGPAGIGKTTIARAFHIRHPNRFQLTCFMDNLRGSYHSGLDDLRLQTQFLSKVLNQDDIKIRHSGAIKERLCKVRVLIILDDVDNIRQLEALANETTWFGPGSRIIVTTENKELLQQHGINNTYDVKFPSDDQALEIFCGYAFRQSYPHRGFKELALKVTKLCGYLPLGLRVVGSSLRGNKDKYDWKEKVRRLETIFDYQDIEEVLRVGYESLHENEQSLFLYIAVFFNYRDGNLVKSMLANNNLDIKYGLKILANKSLIYVSTVGEIVMHKLLQQVGTKAARREEHWKPRRILTDALVVCDVLKHAKGTEQVSGILFDTSRINEVLISQEAFKNMPNLRFLKVINGKDGNVIVHIPKNMDFPDLRLLHWEAYPEKSLPHTFNVKFLVELNMQESKLEYLWQERQPLENLKRIYLSGSLSLKALPDLSNATNLEGLDLTDCKSLVEIPPTFGNLQKLEWLEMAYCTNLEVVPTHFNLASLQRVAMIECSKLRKFPNISTNTTKLEIADTMLEELPNSMERWSRLETLHIYGSMRPCADIEELPDWIKSLDALVVLFITGCPKLASLPELPGSLKKLIVNDCESLETLILFDSWINELYFFDCFNLGREARKVISEKSRLACVPGITVPAQFKHRAKGSSVSVTIPSDHKEFKVCAVVSPKPEMSGCKLFCRIHLNGRLIERSTDYDVDVITTKHLYISYEYILEEDGCLEQDNEISFEFSTSSEDVDVIECGVRIWTFETEDEESIGSYRSSEPSLEEMSKDDESIGSYGSYEPSLEQMSEDDDENLSNGRNDDEFSSEPEYEDDDENLFDGSNEFAEPSAKRLKT